MWREIRKGYRRLVAFLLTAVIVGTNVLGNAGVAFAAGMSESALFLVDGEELREAVQEAKEHREVFPFSSLELAAARKSIRNKYEKLLGKKDGEVYELDLEVDDSYAPEGAAVQVFYHAGTEDVVFLFLNETDMEVEYRVNIDGYETEPVTVKPNTFNIEAEEDTSFGENYEAADMIDDVKTAPKAEVVETKETSAGEESEEAGKDETAGDVSLESKEEESSAADETLESGKESQETEADSTEAASEEGTEEAGETEAVGKEEAETDAQVKEGQETETEAEPESQAEAESETEMEKEQSEAADEDPDVQAGQTLSKSNKQAAIVAVSLGDLEEESAEETELSVAEETEANEAEATEAEKETEAEETVESGETEALDKNSESEAETEDANANTEVETKAEETETEYEETKAEIREESKSEETESTKEGIETEETEKDAATEEPETESKAAVEETKNEEEAVGGIAGPVSQTGSIDEVDGQLLEDDSIELLGKLKGKDYATVTLKNHVNAKAVKVAWEDIEEIISSDGLEEAAEYMVDYVVSLPGGASVKGADSVTEGEDLYFAVEPENGYEIIRVMANGEELDEIENKADLASGSDWKGYSHVYVAEEAAENLLVDIELEELAPIIAASVYTAETDDAIFTINVPQGAFMEEVDLKVEKITKEETVNELTNQAAAALKEGQIVAGVLAYDVAFVSKDSGNEVEPLEAVEVNIRYKEVAVPEEINKQAVTEISVVHLPENEDAEVVTSVENVEETEFVFRTDSFSPVVVVFGATGSVVVEGTYYPSLQQAISSIEGSGDEAIRVQLLDDVEVPYLNPTGKSFTLDLNGHTVYGTEAYYVLYVSASIIIEDSSEEKTGAITHKDGVNGGGVVVNSGTLKLEGGKICGNTSEYGGVKVNSPGEFVMNGGEVSNNSATNGGGVYVWGKFTMTDGSVKDNTCTNYGGGVYVGSGAEFTMTGGNVCGNENQRYYGGGIYNGGSLIVNGGTIEGNKASGQTYGDGGGVYNAKDFRLDEGKIAGNEAARNGGGVANAGTMEINDAAITENINGGIYIQSGDAQLDKVVFSENTGNRPVLYIAREAGKFEAKECTIDGNKVENNVLHIYGGSENNVRKLDQCTISGNENLSTDYRFGNIVCLEGSAHVSFTGCKIEDNSTISASGVATVSVVQAIVTMSDSIIAGNEAKGTSGVGGIKQASSQSKITLDNVVITENRTTNPRGSAGGVYVTFGEFNLKSGAVYSNYSNGNLEDFRFSNNAHWTLAKASGMKDNFLMTENVFDEQHDNYTWLANPEGSSAKMQLDDNVSWNNTAIKGMQGKNELHIWAFPRRIPEGVYISGAGDDANDGYSAETAVKTLERALAALDEFNKGKGDNEKSNTIYVVGTITIREETSWNSNGVVLKRDPSGRFKSVMVIVEGSSGVLTMKNITLDGGAVEGVQSYGLVKVVNKGELIIDEGAVLQNSMKSLGNQFEGGGGVYISGGKVTLKEKGKLTNNSSHNGGAISLMSDSTFIMDGGEISNNTTDRSGQFNRAGYYTSGGGVFIGYNGKMVMNGGSISGNTSYDGGGISLGGPENDVFIKYGSPVFEMNGGTIDSNEAYSSGGGIFVQMNCVATVYGGYITNNHTRALGFGGNFGGGGVYVNGGKDSNYQNGLLQLYKVEITGNQEGSGTGSGAALAGCPTSRTKIYLTNGGVIHENGGRNDLYLSSKRIGGYSGTAQLVISPYMLGGGAYHWTDDEGNELPLNDGFIQVSEQNFYARTPVAGDAVTGLGKIKTYITGNTSGDSKSSPGAAIGSNGDVIIGEEPEEVVELTVEKNWDDSGYENHRPEYVDIRILQSTDGENFTDIGFVRLYRKDNWEKATLKDLPKQDEEGNEFIYKVAETPNGYDSIVTEKEGENSFVVTNTPTYALTLKKEVEGPAASDTFEFKITLSQEDDSLFTGEVDVIRANGNQGKLSFENGEATVRLGGGESLQLKNLQPGMTYKIEETNNGGAKETSMTIDGNLVDTAEGSVQLGGNVNVVTFTNTFEEEKPATGNLSIQKVVAGTAGEKQRAFRFRISLDDQSISGRFGGLNFDGGISEEFALQDQQSRSITDLPAGTGYTVEELGAEELRAEAYEITFEEEGKGIVFAENKINGVISEGESIKIICTNKKDTPDKPDEPDEPDKPDTPDNPGRPNRPSGGGNPPREGDNPGGPGTTTTIETPDVPLADFPNEPVTEEIEEEEVPLAALPRTGDSRQNGALLALLGIAGLGALFSAMALHKRKED